MDNTNTLSDVERKALVGLIQVASWAFFVADDGEDTGEDYIHVPKATLRELGKALDVLDELPDDMPNYALGPSGRAEWALRRFFAGTTIGGSDQTGEAE